MTCAFCASLSGISQMPTVFLIEYSSFGGRKKGGDDDTTSSLPQIPGAVVKYNEFDPASTPQIILNAATAFFKVTTFDGDVFYNFDADDVGDAATVIAGKRDRLAEGVLGFHGAVSNKTGDAIISKVNFVEVPA